MLNSYGVILSISRSMRLSASKARSGAMEPVWGAAQRFDPARQQTQQSNAPIDAGEDHPWRQQRVIDRRRDVVDICDSARKEHQSSSQHASGARAV